MRAILLAVVAIQLGVALPASAENSLESDRSISETLPLFDKNHCVAFKGTAAQLFCGDPELSLVSARLSSAIEDRLNRLPNRRLAIEENAEWIRNRNSSCGIFSDQNISRLDVKSVKACLLKETEERIEILVDPNFDCLATSTTAGMLICSDPDLAIAKLELNSLVVGLMAKLKGDDAKKALTEYERWTRERDRKCNLTGKDNVPLHELSPSEACLADYIKQKTAEIAAAKGDPKRIFGRQLFSPLPDADAVDLCVAQIHSANSCEDFVAVSRVFEIDSEVAANNALVTAEVEMKVLGPFAVCSPVASGCTGACWDLKSGEAKPMPRSRESLPVGQRVSIQKSFAFKKTDSGSWRCETAALGPVEAGAAMNGP